MTLLDEIIKDATNDAVPTANLLRKMRVVGHYLKADALATWVQHESNGYPTALDALPGYRILRPPINGEWSGRFGSEWNYIGASAIPEPERTQMFTARIFQSADELEHLAHANVDQGIDWEPWQVVNYNRYVEQKIAAGFYLETLIQAKKVLTVGAIRGILGSIRNTALDFALELHGTDPLAGSPEGPTVADAAISSTVYNMTTFVYGHANVAQGSGVSQVTTVAVGDLRGLLRAVAEAGLTDPEATRELAAAAVADETEQPGKIKKFMSKVRSGTWSLATGVVTDVAVDTIDAAIKGYLGMH